MITIGERIKHFRKLAGLTQEEAAQQAGVTNATITRYEKGIIDNIPRDRISALALAFGCDPAELMGWSRNEIEAPDRIKDLITQLPLYNIPVSAGSGQWLMDGYEYELTSFEGVPKSADFALKVRGDSMEPIYHNDDIVFVKSRVMVESGDVGVFYFNGDGYLKKLQGNKLVSYNNSYNPISIGEYDEFFCMGRVVGKA